MNVLSLIMKILIFMISISFHSISISISF